ncbi:TPA: tail fiber assembly protein [Enterobacter cloacae]|nr:tail fiber assembly protein [Enterobacter cloacae]
MNYLFSANTVTFYATEYSDRYHEIPSDAVEVNDEIFAVYSGTPPSGRILSSQDGFPAWTDAPPPTREEAIAVAGQKKTESLAAAQATIINWQSKLLLGSINDDEKARLITWLAYIDALNAVDILTAPEITWPEVPAL